jgi:uncharacterized protein YbaR (Trm112 family)
MALPCPACKQPLGLTLEFIFKHPVSACPHCETVLDFTVNDEIKEKYKEALIEIEKIKKEYQGVVKFGSLGCFMLFRIFMLEQVTKN